MNDLFWLSKAQMRRIEPYFPLSHGVPRVDDRRVISGIIFVIRNGLRRPDAPRDYGPPYPLRPMRSYLHVGNRNRRHRHLLAQLMSPDPNIFFKNGSA